ncbi:MAG: diacylglycerol/lipid kinase family protein [Chitinophagales bacterium]
MNEWFVVVNPQSGSGRGKKFWKKKAEKKLIKANIAYQAKLTTYQGHAIVLVTEAIRNGFRKIIAVGGDGTYNEVVNGIFLQQHTKTEHITLAVLAIGTGNDWIKTMNIPKNVDKAIDIIQHGVPYMQDIGLASYHKKGKKYQRYFLNVAGIGFDAYIAQNIEASGKRFGKFSYLTELILGMFKYKNSLIHIKNETVDTEERIFMMAVGLCQYFGDGMRIAPNAIPNDGLFDITLIKDVTKMDVVKELRYLYNGNFQNPKIETSRTDFISVDSKEDVYLQLDGEVLGVCPIAFEIIPSSLKVLVSKKSQKLLQ